MNPSSKDIVWDNTLESDGGVGSYRDAVNDIECILADNFLFDTEQQVTGINWIGIYYNPPGDGNFDWEAIFFEDIGDGTKPGAVIATHYFANMDVNETFIGGSGGLHWYSYSAYLPGPLTFLPGTKYWIAMQSIGTTPPECGFAAHADPIQLSQCVWKSAYFGVPDWTTPELVWGSAFDACFQLTFETLEVECGDVNDDGIVNVADVIYLVSYLYRGGPPPIPMVCVGDVNNDEIVNVADIVYLISYLYRFGPEPSPYCCTPPWN
jgi:hypothetical protein